MVPSFSQTIDPYAFNTTELGKGRREKEEYLLTLNLARYIAVSVTLYRACQIDQIKQMFTGTAQALINAMLEISGGPHTNVKFKTVSSLPMIPTSQLLSDSQSRSIKSHTAASRSFSVKIVAMTQIQRLLFVEWDGAPTRAPKTVYRLQLAAFECKRRFIITN